MGRYDWPGSTESGDDAHGRARHVGRVYAPADVRMPDGSLPPARPTRRGRASTPGPRTAAPPSGPDTGRNLWLPVGPTTVVGGQATGGPRVAGRVRDLAVDPIAGMRVYAASASGGVWFSADRGVSWRPLDEFAVSPNRDTLFPIGNTLACGAIHVLWGTAADGSGDEVIVGTGEPGGSRGTPGGQMTGIGILRSAGPATGGPWAIEAPALRGEAIYRITEDPNDRRQPFAATTNGVFSRPPAGVWAEVVTGLGLNPTVNSPRDTHFTDIAITRLTAPDRVRIWVARHAELHVAEVAAPPGVALNLTGLVFQQVALPGVFAPAWPTFSRVSLATQIPGEVWVLGLRNPTATDTVAAPAQLWRVNGSAALASVAATTITGIPERLFMSAGDQSDYDMAIRVHPTTTSRLYLAGGAAYVNDQWNGSLYRVDVGGTAGTATLIGSGVHSDIHAVHIGPSPSPTPSDRAIWVGCDGGVFLSDRDGNPDTFVARNTGLAVLQPGFVANHPTNDGLLAAGLQDNGTCERTGDTVWREPFLGDGGGLVYDPAHPNRFIRQYTNATWRSSDGTGVSPVFRRHATAPTGQVTSETAEGNSALFYTGAAALAHGGTTHLALGTNRIWYSTDWGGSWVTLPTGTDPRATLNTNLAQDVLEPGTVNGVYTDVVDPDECCADTTTTTGTNFQNSDGVLTTRLAARSDNAGNHRVRLYTLWNRGMAVMDGSRATGSTGAWTWVTTDTERVRRATAGAEQTAVDNGDPTSFLPGRGIVNDIAVHLPDRAANGSFYVATTGAPGSGAGREIDTLWWYDGDGRFVPCGLRRAHPRGAWSGTRIPAPALSVVVDPVDPGVVYVGTSIGVVRGNLTMVDDGNGTGTFVPQWAWIAFDSGLPEAAVHDLAVFRHDGIRLLRAALQARGVWEVDLGVETIAAHTYLRVFPTDTRRRHPTPLTGVTTNGESGVRWDASPDVVFDLSGATWPSGTPTEPDLHELPFAGQVGQFAAQSFSSRQFKIHVLVHHRWAFAAPPGSIRVALLRRDGPTSGNVPTGALWASLVSIAAGGPVPASLPDGWVKAGVQLIGQPTVAVETRMPRPVTFDIDLTGVANGTRVTFLAVVMSDIDQITAADALMQGGVAVSTVEQLVQHSRHTAARTLRLS